MPSGYWKNLKFYLSCYLNIYFQSPTMPYLLHNQIISLEIFNHEDTEGVKFPDKNNLVTINIDKKPLKYLYSSH